MLDEMLQLVNDSKETASQAILKPQEVEVKPIVTYFLNRDMLTNEEREAIKKLFLIWRD